MLNFRLTLLLASMTIQVTLCFKCEFQKDKYSTIENIDCCNIVPDSSDIAQNFSLEVVTDVDYNGTEIGSIHMSETEYPICKMFPNLEQICINDVKSVDENFLNHCKKVDKLTIITTEMEELPENFFHNNLELYRITLKNNKLKTLPENIFTRLKELLSINLSENQITFLPANIFNSLPKLERLYLDYNKIQTLPPNLFDGLSNLEVLALDHNEILDLPKNIFTSLVNLNTLYLYNNNLTVLHSDSFGIHRQFSDVTLHSNKFVAIDEKWFDNTNIENITMIDVENNICVNKIFFNEGEDLREEFKTCFENYRPREE
ncbi:unnamed protein product [Chironomus riparius]|uniref:Uncharacterized protein n=1 Tax=Chironomus riparius TaxID=315576 RepID=A0A9N9RMP6_9DIPT|nr:unnamed protein product [Chironomus riparius]